VQLLKSHFQVRDKHSKLPLSDGDQPGRPNSIKEVLNLSGLRDRPLATANRERLEKYLVLLINDLLGKSSIPFWNPKYSAHMCMDTSMPGNLGYIAALLYNAK